MLSAPRPLCPSRPSAGSARPSRPVRRLASPRPLRREPRLPVPRRLHFKFHPRPGRAGAGGLGDRHRRQARVLGARPGQPSPPTPGPASSGYGRGLRPPLLVISDGGTGLIAALETVLPRACASVSHPPLPEHPGQGARDAQAEVKADSGRIFDESTPPPAAPSTRPAGGRRFGATWRIPRRRRVPRPTTSSPSPSTCASRRSTGSGSGTPTSSSAPSARPAGG